MCKLQEQSSKPHYELQDIFKIYADDFLNTHQTTSIQRKAISDIQACRTSSLGYNARECTICKNVEFSYNSCRNRNCPKCQGQKRFKWIQDRLKTTINVPYFRTVFILPILTPRLTTLINLKVISRLHISFDIIILNKSRI